MKSTQRKDPDKPRGRGQKREAATPGHFDGLRESVVAFSHNVWAFSKDVLDMGVQKVTEYEVLKKMRYNLRFLD
ncbi:hypothetical protein R1flu_007941, partial [Riccia fluitans]